MNGEIQSSVLPEMAKPTRRNRKSRPHEATNKSQRGIAVSQINLRRGFVPLLVLLVTLATLATLTRLVLLLLAGLLAAALLLAGLLVALLLLVRVGVLARV